MKKAKESPTAPTSGPLKIRIEGKEREFDIENPTLP